MQRGSTESRTTSSPHSPIIISSPITIGNPITISSHPIDISQHRSHPHISTNRSLRGGPQHIITITESNRPRQ